MITSLLVTLIPIALGTTIVITRVTVAEAKQEENGRFLFYNPSASTLVGMLLGIPVSLALPAFKNNTVELGRACGYSANSLEDDQAWEKDFYWDTIYEEQLSQLTTYFGLLEVYSLECQERLICELISEPEKFSPISDLVEREIRFNYGPVTPDNDSLMWHYVSAAYLGFSSSIQDCAMTYANCPLSTSQILDMRFLKIWQLARRVFNIDLYKRR
ncbi:hypothetical protein SK128_018215 [Halocaridina rubra]|uniref:Uncharacterized protein n=1 Tax=Halocaridina rubra TaxID=373956 RepID=A0AAN8WE74_HALRR